MKRYIELHAIKLALVGFAIILSSPTYDHVRARCISDPTGEINCESSQLAICDNRSGEVIGRCLNIESDLSGEELAIHIFQLIVPDEVHAFKEIEIRKALLNEQISTSNGMVYLSMSNEIRDRLR